MPLSKESGNAKKTVGEILIVLLQEEKLKSSLSREDCNPAISCSILFFYFIMFLLLRIFSMIYICFF